MKKRIVMDLGSTVCRAFAENEEGVAFVPSLAALDRGTGRPLACGEEARLLSLRTPGDLDLVRPFADREAVQAQIAELLIREAAKELDRGKGVKTGLILALPTYAGKDEEKPYLDGALGAEGKDVTVVHPLYAAKAAASPDAGEKVFVMHIGASGSTVCCCEGEQFSAPLSTPTGGKAFDDALGDLLYDRYGILLDDFAAEQAKLAGAGFGLTEDTVIECTGLARKVGLPKKFSLSAKALDEVFQPLLASLCAPLGSLVSEFGKPSRLLLSGGGAKLKGLAAALGAAIGVPAELPEEPENAVILGLQKLTETKQL